MKIINTSEMKSMRNLRECDALYDYVEIELEIKPLVIKHGADLLDGFYDHYLLQCDSVHTNVYIYHVVGRGVIGFQQDIPSSDVEENKLAVIMAEDLVSKFSSKILLDE